LNKILLLAFVIFGGIYAASQALDGSFEDTLEAAKLHDGVIVRSAPVQKDLSSQDRFQMERSGYQLTAVAAFEVEGLVLAAKRYRSGREADLSPVDLALGWGVMSAHDYLAQMKIWQSRRFYWWRYPSGTSVDNSTVIGNSSNMHMIPANDEIEAALKDVREGDVVRIAGHLVNARHADGWRWNTSTRRTDTGAGACEIILVASVGVMGRPG